MKTYQIYPIQVGFFKHAEKSNWVYQKDWGTKLQAPIIMYLIKGEEENILVDTGCSDEAWSEKYHQGLFQPEEMKPLVALKRLGVEAEDVRTIVNTHLHWDHSFNNHLFPNAKIYVQKKELEFARNPLPTQYGYYEAHRDIVPCWQKAEDQYVVIDGDYDLREGIRLITTPGHTPGFQSVLVNTTQGVYCIASDTVCTMENWEKGTEGHRTPNGIVVSMFDYYDSFEKIEKAADFVLPGHDARAFDSPVYPPEK